MSCLVDVGILEENGELTQIAKEKFIEEVQDILIYGTEAIPENKKPLFTDGVILDPNPNPESLPDLKDPMFEDFQKNWFTRYKEIANTLNVKSNFSLLPAIADPLALAGSAFNTELPPLEFPTGFLPYFAGLIPQKLLIDLGDAGLEEFLSPAGPVKLIKTLISVKAPPIPPIPSIPIITPPIPPVIVVLPSPPITDQEIIDLQAALSIELTQAEPIPQIQLSPELVLSDLAAKQFAPVTAIPKLLADLITKLPSLLMKIGNVKEVMKEICKMVKDSGVGGKIEETSTIEKAANSVLSRKISEMLLVASMSSTIGSAPGSATTSVTQITSGKEKPYKSKPKKASEPVKKKTPAEKAYLYATGYEGSYFSHPNKQFQYISALFYREYSIAEDEDGKYNLWGMPIETIDENDSSNSSIAKDDIISDSNGWQKKLGKSKNSPNGSQNSPNGKTPVFSDDAPDSPFAFKLNDPKDVKILKAAPVTFNNGFTKRVARDAEKQSSCGMFLRACIRAAGCNNFSFLSQYQNGTALSSLLGIGLMRNYRWVPESADDKNPSILGDINAELNAKEGEPSPVAAVLKEIHANWDRTLGALPNTIDEAIRCITINANKNGKQKQPINALINDWGTTVATATGPIVPNIPWLKRYMKDLDKKAIIYGVELEKLALSGKFPKLDQGDAVLLLRTIRENPDKGTEPGSEHILLVAHERLADNFGNHEESKETQIRGLDSPISAIEGGALDDGNLDPKPKIKYNPYYKVEHAALGAWKGEFEYIHPKSQAYAINHRKDGAKQYQWLDPALEAIGVANLTNAPPPLPDAAEIYLEGKVELPNPRPTAILSVIYNRGFTKRGGMLGLENNSGPGFYLGCTSIARTAKSTNEAAFHSGADVGLSPGARKIVAIIKTNNYCNELENKDEGYVAINYMDSHPALGSYDSYVNSISAETLNRIAYDTLDGIFDAKLLSNIPTPQQK